LYILEQQKSKSERHFIEDAVKKTFLGLIEANKTKRKPSSLSHLTLGLECGGSDGFSGISANPALGYASDLLVALGGTTVLSEFPELNGVEQELINRCVSETEAKKFAYLMDTYAARAIALGSAFKNNPSPGNIKDGLITDAMKSAGAAKKGGSSPVTDVLDYTEKSTRKGLNLLCTPGNDVESTTGLAGSGCTVIAFTTGLGTPTGNPIAPIIKISSNNALSERMPDIIDFNTGTVITGEDSIQEKGEELLDYIRQAQLRWIREVDHVEAGLVGRRVGAHEGDVDEHVGIGHGLGDGARLVGDDLGGDPVQTDLQAVRQPADVDGLMAEQGHLSALRQHVGHPSAVRLSSTARRPVSVVDSRRTSTLMETSTHGE
jgi:hypothetical protein